MTQEEKELLLKDLCSRLPYGVKVAFKEDSKSITDKITMIGWPSNEFMLYEASEFFAIEEIKPYLRPMLSMTDEEREEYQKFLFPCPDYNGRVVVGVYHRDLYKVYDWLNARHFDYRGLIEKGLALEAPDDMYK